MTRIEPAWLFAQPAQTTRGDEIAQAIAVSAGDVTSLKFGSECSVVRRHPPMRWHPFAISRVRKGFVCTGFFSCQWIGFSGTVFCIDFGRHRVRIFALVETSWKLHGQNFPKSP